MVESLPQVDVVLPLKAPAPWLDETLSGLKEQTYDDWRLVCTVAEDSVGLIDEVFKYFPLAKIVIVENEMSFPKVLNQAFSECEAPFVARIDQDDVPLPQRLELQVRYLTENPTVAVVSTPVLMVNQQGQALGESFHVRTEHVRHRLLLKNQLAHPAVMMRRSSVPTHGPYSEEALNGEDYELWLRLAATSELHILSHPLTRCRVHANQMSAVGYMDSVGRRLIHRRKIELAEAIGIAVMRVHLQHLVWTTIQISRSLRRRRLIKG